MSKIIVVLFSVIAILFTTNINAQIVWQIGKFDNSSEEFGYYNLFPSVVNYAVPSDWESRNNWKWFPKGQEAWQTDDRHPYNCNDINIFFEAVAGNYKLTIGQLKTGASEVVKISIDGDIVKSINTSTKSNKEHIIPININSSGCHKVTLGKFIYGFGYQIDAINLEKSNLKPVVIDSYNCRGAGNFAGESYEWTQHKPIEHILKCIKGRKTIVSLYWGSKDDLRSGIVYLNDKNFKVSNGGYQGYKWIDLTLDGKYVYSDNIKIKVFPGKSKMKPFIAKIKALSYTGT